MERVKLILNPEKHYGASYSSESCEIMEISPLVHGFGFVYLQEKHLSSLLVAVCCLYQDGCGCGCRCIAFGGKNVDCVCVHGTYWSGNVAILLGLLDYEGFGQDANAIVEDEVEEGRKKKKKIGWNNHCDWDEEISIDGQAEVDQIENRWMLHSLH